jgi:hypothetical protein
MAPPLAVFVLLSDTHIGASLLDQTLLSVIVATVEFSDQGK